MCHKTSKIGFLVLGIGIGLPALLLVAGIVAIVCAATMRVLAAAALIVLGFLLTDCR